MGSQVSESDLRLYATLSNPQKVNLGRMSGAPTGLRASARVEEHSGDEDVASQSSSAASRHSYAPESYARSAQQYASSGHSSVHRRSNPSSVRSVTSASSSKSDDKTTVSSRADVRSHVSHDANPARFDFNDLLRQHIDTQPAAPEHRSSMSDRDLLDKQTILMDMERLKGQGIVLSKQWTIDDRLEDMRFEVRRHLLHAEECNTVSMMRDGMRLMCTGIEMINVKLGILDVDGWASEVCGNMVKYDSALSRIYRKYWKRSTSSSPEMEIVMGLVGSIGMYHFKRKISSHMFAGAQGQGIPSAAAFTPRQPVSAGPPSEILSDEEEESPP